MKPRLRPGAAVALIVLAALFAAISPAAALSPQAAAWPPLFVPEPGFSELEPSPGTDTGTEPLPLPRLIDAAFLASGTELARLPGYEARLDAMLAELSANTGPVAGTATGDPAARGEAVLEFLHRKLLDAYVADATTLDLVFDGGRFNCVSSALLYVIAARSLGLDVAGVKTTDHAFCVLRADGREIDVETTNRYGFDPGNKKEFKDSFGRVTGYAYAPPGAYSTRETMDDRAFVGLVLANRAGLLERSGRFREALRLGVDLDALAPGGESRAFLLDRVNNVAADLSRRRDFAGAMALADAARAALGEEPRLVELSRAAAYNGAAALAAAGRWEEALEAAGAILSGDVAPDAAREKAAFANSSPAIPSPAIPSPELGALVEASVGNLVGARIRAGDFAGARAVLAAYARLLEAAAGPTAGSAVERRIGEAELARAVESLPFADALAAADRALAAGYASRARWEEVVAYLYGNEANRLAGEGDLLGAAAVADAGAAAAAKGRATAAGGAARDSGRSGSLSRFAAELRHAFAAKAHNDFARLYNAGDYGRALDAVLAALELLPGDATLHVDLETARRAAGR